LWSLQTADNLTQEQQAKVAIILRHYPSTQDIDDWARGMAKAMPLEFDGLGAWLGDEGWLALEDEHVPLHAGVPLQVEREPTTCAERMAALHAVNAFFSGGLCGSGNLTSDQRRSLMYVCRHFPMAIELDGLGRWGGTMNSETIPIAPTHQSEWRAWTWSRHTGFPKRVVRRPL
jgi:hypothetical protein